MIENFLEIEVLLSPNAYKRIRNMDEKEVNELINKINEFKNTNDKFILLDEHFLDVFLNHDLEWILKEYGNFDFIAYYTGEKFEIKKEDKKEVKEERKEEKKKIVDDVEREKLIKKILSKEEEDKEKIEEEERKAEREKRMSEIRGLKSINTGIKWYAKDIDAMIKVYDDTDVSGKSTCEGTIDDFIKYFRDRYERIKKLIERKVQRKAYPLNGIKKKRKEDNIFVVGIVSDINTTKNGHKLVEIEDENASFTVLLTKDKIANGELPNDILLDEVIGFVGTINDKGNLMFADMAVRPDITPKEPNRTDEQIYVAFLSDIHVGSYEFMKDTFNKFIEFLNGNVNNGVEEKVVSRIKYISIAGDLVDGVGIYPGQEEDLYEIDIISQYEEIATYLEQIPEHIHIIISPGNHDAVRPAEPQPKLPEKIAKLFDMDNITLVGNPAMVNVHGLDFLLYHGRSFDDIVGQVPSAKYTEPSTIMKELLKRRLLCPTYGGRCPIAPEHKDYLVIENEPDVFHTGHIHINGYGIYKGVAMVNSGTFQEQTAFQKKMGIKPTPGIVPILDLSKVGMNGHYLEWDNGKLMVKK